MSKIVNRTLDVFEAFAEHRTPLLLTDLMKLLDIPLSSCHDMVRALEQRGYLYEVRHRSGYYPTARLLDVARAIVDHDPVSVRAAPVLERLTQDLQASASLAKAKGLQLTYLAVNLPPDPLRFTVTVGSAVRNLHATSAGKALLGSLPVEELGRVVASLALEPLTPATITSPEALLEDVRAGEARGWFVNREESVEDALTLSARFVWSGSVYVVTVAGTLKRMERQYEAAAAALMAAARALQSHDDAHT